MLEWLCSTFGTYVSKAPTTTRNPAGIGPNGLLPPPRGPPDHRPARPTEQADLAACEAFASAFPASGQTTSFRTGDDGDLEAGADLSYTDTGNGTIIDNNTGLEWEKKSDDDTINDKDNTYTWENAFAVHIAGLNTDSFSGHNDWRLPNVKELQSIVNYQFWAVSDAFKIPCAPGATVTGGSCTAASGYWSSTTFAGSPGFAWGVGFFVGDVDVVSKSSSNHVRAVRGGL